MRKYEEYKDSGIEWIGEVPEEWEMYKIKYLINNYKAGPFGSSLITSNLLSDGNILVYTPEHIANMTTNLSNNLYLPNERKEEMSQFLVRHGDLIFPIVGSLGRAMFISDEMPEGIINQRLAKFRLKENLVDKNFFIYYFTKCNLVKEYIDVNSRGAIIVNLTKDIVTSMYIPLPPLSAQQSIASFLDAKTKPIDDIISKREKQIELLEEMKSAIISHAVTKGLNPDAKMKDSGIEWIGEIPEHWTICKFRRVIDVLTDFTANGSFGDLAKNVKYLSEPDYSRLVRLTDLRLNIDNEDGVWLDETSHNYLKKSELFGGELLMANVGAYAGYTCIMPHKKIIATLGPNMYLIRVNNNVAIQKFMNYLLGSKPYFSWLQMLANASAQPKINKDTVKSLSVCIPESIEEQERIISYLDTKTSKLDARIAKRRRQIELLQEYKQALITDAVTGKIDVRGFNS